MSHMTMEIYHLQDDLAALKARVDAKEQPTAKKAEPDPRADYSWWPEGHERFALHGNLHIFYYGTAGAAELETACQNTREDAANCAIEYHQSQIENYLFDGLAVTERYNKIAAARKWREAR